MRNKYLLFIYTLFAATTILSTSCSSFKSINAEKNLSHAEDREILYSFADQAFAIPIGLFRDLSSPETSFLGFESGEFCGLTLELFSEYSLTEVDFINAPLVDIQAHANQFKGVCPGRSSTGPVKMIVDGLFRDLNNPSASYLGFINSDDYCSLTIELYDDYSFTAADFEKAPLVDVSQLPGQNKGVCPATGNTGPVTGGNGSSGGGRVILILQGLFRDQNNPSTAYFGLGGTDYCGLTFELFQSYKVTQASFNSAPLVALSDVQGAQYRGICPASPPGTIGNGGGDSGGGQVILNLEGLFRDQNNPEIAYYGQGGKNYCGLTFELFTSYNITKSSFDAAPLVDVTGARYNGICPQR